VGWGCGWHGEGNHFRRMVNAATQVGLAGVSNAAAAAFTNPIDVAKVRLQMRGEGVRGGSSMGVAGTLFSILRTEGVAGLYRGISASLVREMSYSGIRMGMYEPTKNALGGTDPANTSLSIKVAAGAITGSVGSVLANPFDLIKVRMQRPGELPYTSLRNALAEITRSEGGVAGLWRGCTPTVQRAALLTASQVPAYDHAKHLLVDGGHMHEGYACHFACSMFAGVVAAAVTSPSDLVKSRMMAQKVDAATGRGALYADATSCYLQIVRAEGAASLFKGFHGQWLRIGPHTTVSLMCFEQLRHLAGMAYL